jgi:hypothetical protein
MIFFDFISNSLVRIPQITRRWQRSMLLWMHFLLVTVHVCVTFKGSRAELATVPIDACVLSRMFNETGFLFEFLAALFTPELFGRVDKLNVILKQTFLLKLFVDSLLAALIAWIRTFLLVLVPVHVNCVTEFVDQKMTAKLTLD